MDTIYSQQVIGYHFSGVLRATIIRNVWKSGRVDYDRYWEDVTGYESRDMPTDIMPYFNTPYNGPVVITGKDK